MLIGEFSDRTGLSRDTLRFYEKIGLLEPARDSSGRRQYTEEDVLWTEFIGRLKTTGMPLADIAAYADLRKAGTSTLSKRLNMLETHRGRLAQTISELETQMVHLDDKISLYKRQIQDLL